VYAQISESTMDALDITLDVITAPLYNVEEIWDAESMFEEVDKAFAKAVFGKRMEFLFETPANKLGRYTATR